MSLKGDGSGLRHRSDYSIKGLLASARARLKEKGIDSYGLDSQLLLAKALGYSKEQLIRHAHEVVDGDICVAFDALLQRRLLHEPMSHILGVREFWSREFRVTSDTLDPRADSEVLIEAVVRRKKQLAEKPNILDLGTGTGCLFITLLCELPDANGVGVDVSRQALDIAMHNMHVHGVTERGRLVESDWCDALDQALSFDVIITNPPYIPHVTIDQLQPEVSLYEPYRALDGGEDGFDSYKKIFSQIPDFLASGGMVVVECGVDQHEGIIELGQAQGLLVEEVVKDLAGISRCVVFRRDVVL